MRTSVDVHNYLVEREAPHELVPLKGRVRSPKRVAAVLGLPPKQVGRVVLFDAEDGPVAALIPASLEPNPSRVAGAAGVDELTEVQPERASDLTGFLPEAMPPAGLPEGTTVVMDRRLSVQEVLYFPGGEATSVLKIRPDDLARATHATVARISG
jgi:Cys-tRNA(Pro)/Cys-tRNA(Cys) deacylase